MADIDLAYSCVDTAGAAASSTFVLNRLLRTRQDTPSQLRDLAAQAAAAKQSLEQLLSMIDCDEPCFTSESDVTQLSGHLNEITSVFRDVQEHAAKVSQASRSIEKSTWTIVWPVAKISASEEVLRNKLGILATYMDGSYLTGPPAPAVDTPAPDSTQPVVVPAPQSSPISSEPLVVQHSLQGVQEEPSTAEPSSSTPRITKPALASRPEPSILEEKAQLRMRELGATAISLGSSPGTTGAGTSSPDGEYAVPMSAIDSPPQYEEMESQFQQMHLQQFQQQASQQPVTARRDTTESSRAPDSPNPGQTARPPQSQVQVQLQRQMQPYQRALAATNPVQRNASPATTAGMEAMKTALGYNKLSMISARKMKSSLLLTKSNSFGPDDDDAGLPQGDELFPDRFLERVTNYSRSITPAWGPITIPAKKKKKADKHMYRNRFTNTKDLDVSPDHLTSHFKVVEKDIWDAIMHRRPESVQEIMEHRWRDNIVVEKQDQVTALHVAAALGLCRIVKILLSVGATPNATDRYGLTPLHYAADFGCPRCIHLLVNGGAHVDKDMPKQNIKTPLRYAVAMGNSDAVAALLERGAILHVQASAVEDTLLYAAVSTGNVALCDVLLKAGLNPRESFEVLALAATKSVELLSVLVGAGADINLQGPAEPAPSEKSKKTALKAPLGPGDTLLHKYVALDDMRMVDFLLGSLHASPNVPGEEGRFPLHVAATPSTKSNTTTTGPASPSAGTGANSLLIAQALVAHGADIEARNVLGQTPLQVAVVWGRADVARLLCSSGANVDAVDHAGLSPWTEVQRADYIRRPGTTNLLGRYHVDPRAAPWSGGDFQGVLEIVGAHRTRVRLEQQRQVELREQERMRQKQQQGQLHNKVEMPASFPGAVELPLVSAESRPAQEVHGQSAVLAQLAAEERRVELPA